MKKFNYKSDFDFILSLVDSEGNDIGFPDFDFVARLRSKSGYKHYEASYVGGVCSNCFNDNDKLHIVCAKHGLVPGVLELEFNGYLPDSIYPQGLHSTVTPMSIGIELVTGAGDEPMTAEASLSMPVVLLTAYDLAVRQGYKGTAEEYMTATLQLVDTVEDARQTLSQSQSAAQQASEASALAAALVEESRAAVNDAVQDANSAASEARLAASDCITASSQLTGIIEEVNNTTSQATDATQSALQAANDATEIADSLRGRSLADTDRDNYWAATQTFGDIIVGNIVQTGSSYETHAEVVYTKQDMIHLRDGAVAGIPQGSYVGLVATLYNGRDNGYLVYDHEGARVGKEGDTEPLLTRAEKSEMVSGAPLVWDSQRNRAVSGEFPSLPQMRTVEMVVTYEDDSTETFNVYVQ